MDHITKLFKFRSASQDRMFLGKNGEEDDHFLTSMTDVMQKLVYLDVNMKSGSYKKVKFQNFDPNADFLNGNVKDVDEIYDDVRQIAPKKFELPLKLDYSQDH